ncbi:ABC transporter ATP-binding protein [Rothia aerolata]|uniref:Peptide ABC transporter ATP-binding protein n=1 Tax=Rothia aerolata TaxID=1812262 RepID=A0A917ISB0_9MICC|nr:ATP-binding cassette domain-containing protein [Rothia aerolata]GGH61831.1 peptide ABC transporter ATP-binding protein [Rothia aerolata]
MIEIRNGAKNFQSNQVFEKIDLVFEPATYYTFTGPNGSGKSTLMSCLLRQTALSEGEILWCGKDTLATNATYAEQVFGINDSIGWLPGLTVGNHLKLMEKNSKNLPNLLNQELLSPEEALEELGVPQAFEKEPYALSSGQEQRARLASLLVRPASYYFLDEPEKRLDAQGVEWIAHWVQSRVEAGAMVCIATHDPVLNQIPGTVNISFPLEGSGVEPR